jgi:hypothetical protein
VTRPWPIVPKPAEPPSDVPHPLTFFVTRAQRRAILAALKAIHADRTRAILKALAIKPA